MMSDEKLLSIKFLKSEFKKSVNLACNNLISMEINEKKEKFENCLKKSEKLIESKYKNYIDEYLKSK